jgi:hypothetical protein
MFHLDPLNSEMMACCIQVFSCYYSCLDWQIELALRVLVYLNMGQKIKSLSVWN